MRGFHGEPHTPLGATLRSEPAPRGEAGIAPPHFYENPVDDEVYAAAEMEVVEAELQALDTAPPFASCGHAGGTLGTFTGGAGEGGEGYEQGLEPTSSHLWRVEAGDDHDLMIAALSAEMATFRPEGFDGSPPGWLVEAAVRGCHTLDQVAATTSLEHQGPIDALSAEPAQLAAYNMWLLAASKRVDYLRERALEAERERSVAANRESHARRGAALQQAAWSQRGNAIEERKNVARLNHLKARGAKREAAARRADARAREARWAGHVAALHSEVAELPEDVRHAKEILTHNRHVGARTIKAAAGAIEQRKGELQQQREAEARAMRDRVRASSMVTVPAEVAHAITHATGCGASSSAASSTSNTAPAKSTASYRALTNPDSVLAACRSARTTPRSSTPRSLTARSSDTPRSTTSGASSRNGSSSAACTCTGGSSFDGVSTFNQGFDPAVEC
uniref:Uncharacterized protein n=1 Tax=Haptolina brevifila TaxID=156173 RepID=A0A7S2J5J7_9EUKA